MPKIKARTSADFIATHIREVRAPNRIREVLKELRSIGREHWIYEGELISEYKIGSRDLNEFRDLFKEHWIQTDRCRSGERPKRIWFADPKLAAKFRNAGSQA